MCMDAPLPGRRPRSKEKSLSSRRGSANRSHSRATALCRCCIVMAPSGVPSSVAPSERHHRQSTPANPNLPRKWSTCPLACIVARYCRDLRLALRKRRKEGMSGELQPGAKAPAFTLPRDGGGTVSLADFAGRVLVLYFYPKAGLHQGSDRLLAAEKRVCQSGRGHSRLLRRPGPGTGQI